MHAVPGECTAQCSVLCTVLQQLAEEMTTRCMYRADINQDVLANKVCVEKYFYVHTGTVGCYEEPTVVPEKRSHFEQNFEMNIHTTK